MWQLAPGPSFPRAPDGRAPSLVYLPVKNRTHRKEIRSVGIWAADALEHRNRSEFRRDIEHANSVVTFAAP